MGNLRVIAVESNILYKKEPVVACIYKQELLHVYDCYGNLYYQKEYFSDFDSLEYYVNRGRYEWTDFLIPSGRTVCRDGAGLIYVDDEEIHAFAPLNEQEGKIGKISLKLFCEFLKTANRGNNVLIEAISEEYISGAFRRQIEQTVDDNRLQKILEVDKEIIVKTRIFGRKYIIEHVKQLISSDDELRNDKITFFFTRLFKLERANYIFIE